MPLGVASAGEIRAWFWVVALVAGVVLVVIAGAFLGALVLAGTVFTFFIGSVVSISAGIVLKILKTRL